MSSDPLDQPDNGAAQFAEVQAGGDKNTATHVQPAELSEANKVMPGEQPDPRLC